MLITQILAAVVLLLGTWMYSSSSGAVTCRLFSQETKSAITNVTGLGTDDYLNFPSDPHLYTCNDSMQTRPVLQRVRAVSTLPPSERHLAESIWHLSFRSEFHPPYLQRHLNLFWPLAEPTWLQNIRAHQSFGPAVEFHGALLRFKNGFERLIMLTDGNPLLAGPHSTNASLREMIANGWYLEEVLSLHTHPGPNLPLWRGDQDAFDAQRALLKSTLHGILPFRFRFGVITATREGQLMMFESAE